MSDFALETRMIFKLSSGGMTSVIGISLSETGANWDYAGPGLGRTRTVRSALRPTNPKFPKKIIWQF